MVFGYLSLSTNSDETRTTPASGSPDITGVIYVATDGSGDYTTLSAAITAQGANKLYKLGAGDFTISSQMVITQNSIVIQGSGVDVTRLMFDTGTTGASFIVQGSLGTGRALTSNSVRGVKTIAVASGHGIVADDWVYIKCTRQVQSAGNNGQDAEIHQVKSVTATQLTIRDYLYEDYTTATTSTVYKISFVNNFQLKDITLYDNSATPKTAITEQADCLFLLCYNLKISNVKFEKMYYCSAAFQNCYNTDIHGIYFESPRFINGATYWVNYGGDVLSATTNFNCDGGWGNHCRHTWTTDVIAGQTYGNGKQRNIKIANFNSYNANTSHFDTHEGAVGISFVGCGATGGYHQLDGDYVYSGAHSQQTDQVKGFTTRSPAIFNSCWADNCENYGFAIFNDNDTVSSGDSQPGGDGTQIINCRVSNTQTGDGTSVGNTRGVRILPNRKDVIISGCYFNNILEEPIMVGDASNNIIIKDNIFHSCGASLSSSRGLIRFLGNHDDVIVSGNMFGAGTPAGSAHPIEFATSVDHFSFKDNDTNGLTNKTPIIPAISTDVIIEDNLALNPYNLLTTPINTSNNTIGLYGGTTSTIVTAVDYTIVGSDVLMTVSGGTVSAILVKDGAGNTVVSGITSLNGQYIPKGFKLRVTHTGAPTVTVYAV